MARIASGSIRVQKTDNEVVAEIWLADRKITVYMDSDTEIIAIDNSGQFNDGIKDLTEAILWLADGVPDRTIEEIQS